MPPVRTAAHEAEDVALIDRILVTVDRQRSYTGPSTLSGGALESGNAASFANLAGQVYFNGGTFKVSANTIVPILASKFTTTFPGSTATSLAGANDLTTLGVAEASQVLNLAGSQTTFWQGQTVDATCVLVKFTWGGDATLDGKINVDDYGQIDFNVGSSGSVFGWFNGDFNFDGKINVDDYGIIDFNVSAQGPPL